MQSNLSYWLQKIYWGVMLLFKKDRKRYLSLYHNLGILANDILYYDVALSHKSKSIILNGRRMNNERLEFLGDAVITTNMPARVCLHPVEPRLSTDKISIRLPWEWASKK